MVAVLGLLRQLRVRSLVAKLGSWDAREREEAIEGLTAMGVAAVPALLEQLEKGSGQAKVSAAVALGRLRPPQAIPALIVRLGDPQEMVRDAARDALQEFGQEAVQLLIEHLSDPDELVATGAAETLGRIKDPRAVVPLVKCLSSGSLTMREAAADALGEIGHPSAVPALARLLEDPAPALQRVALAALDKIGTPEALEAVKQWRAKHNRT